MAKFSFTVDGEPHTSDEAEMSVRDITEIGVAGAKFLFVKDMAAKTNVFLARLDTDPCAAKQARFEALYDKDKMVPVGDQSFFVCVHLKGLRSLEGVD